MARSSILHAATLALGAFPILVGCSTVSYKTEPAVSHSHYATDEGSDQHKFFWESKDCGLSPQGYSPWTSLNERLTAGLLLTLPEWRLVGLK